MQQDLGNADLFASCGASNAGADPRSVDKQHRHFEKVGICLLTHGSPTVPSLEESLLIVCGYRNIYYKDPELFKSQKVVDRYVDILSYTFGLQRAALHVVSLLAYHVIGS